VCILSRMRAFKRNNRVHRVKNMLGILIEAEAKARAERLRFSLSETKAESTYLLQITIRDMQCYYNR
jgi:hypothetical protein